MRINGILDQYSSNYGAQAASEKNKYDNVSAYQKSLQDKYACLKSGNSYSVEINRGLLTKSMSDPKTAEWLEYNLALIPKGIDSLNQSVAANGGKVMSCKVNIDGYDSISTEVYAVFEGGSEVDDQKKINEEAIKRRREEKKAEEKRAEGKEAAEKMPGVDDSANLDMEKLLSLSSQFDARV